MTNEESARESLHHAENVSGEALVNEYSSTMALIGIGYAILAVADAIRDRTAEIVASLRT